MKDCIFYFVWPGLAFGSGDMLDWHGHAGMRGLIVLVTTAALPPFMGHPFIPNFLQYKNIFLGINSVLTILSV